MTETQNKPVTDDWSHLRLRTKLNILEGESTILFDLLAENEELITLLRSGASKQQCIEFITKNW